MRLPRQVRAALASIIGIAPDESLPIALECDDVLMWKQTALYSDTVLAMVHAAVVSEVDNDRFVQLALPNAPKLYSEMGIVFLRGRSHSPLAQLAIERLIAMRAQVANHIDGRIKAAAETQTQEIISHLFV